MPVSLSSRRAPRTGAAARRAAARRAGPSARTRIFETASRLFYARGIRGVGVDLIADEADTTKMSLYRSFPSKDELVAEWLRDYDARFWAAWEARAGALPDRPGEQLVAAFTELASRIADSGTRGCPMANTAVELIDRTHPARKVIEGHKAKLRKRLTELCDRLGAKQPDLLADQLFLLMEGAQITRHTLGPRGPARNFAPAAKALIALHLNSGRESGTDTRSP